MQTHRYSFFGQKTAMILQSGDWADPWLFLTFIKKREGGTWEKLAEGKSVKLSLPEIVALRDVIAGNRPKWKTYHKSNGTGTPISAGVESNKEGTTVLISAGEYLRPINYPELIILEKLLEHVFEEKITNATGKAKPVPEESSHEELTVETNQEPTLVTPVIETKIHLTRAQPKPAPVTSDVDLSLADTFPELGFPPLPHRLPGGTFPMTGRLKTVKKENGTTTLFLKLASGEVKEVPGNTIVGADLHGTEVDLVIKTFPTPNAPDATPEKVKPAPKRGKANKIPEQIPDAPAKGEPSAAPTEPGIIRASSVKAVTEKALLVTNAGGTELWIPKSAIAGDVPAPAAPQDGAWQFAVKDWFAQKADFQNWVKST